MGRAAVEMWAESSDISVDVYFFEFALQNQRTFSVKLLPTLKGQQSGMSVHFDLDR